MIDSQYNESNMIMLGWKAWYGDGKTFTSKNYKWVDIPVTNFQYLKKFYPRKTDSFAGLDLYCITSDHNLIQSLIKADPRNIKIGQLMDRDEWFKFEEQIEKDKEIILEMI